MSLTPFRGPQSRPFTRRPAAESPSTGSPRPDAQFPNQEQTMFPMPFRIPRRWRVLFWRLSDRLRKPSADPMPFAAADESRLDQPAFLRRRQRP